MASQVIDARPLTTCNYAIMTDHSIQLTVVSRLSYTRTLVGYTVDSVLCNYNLPVIIHLRGIVSVSVSSLRKKTTQHAISPHCQRRGALHCTIDMIATPTPTPSPKVRRRKRTDFKWKERRISSSSYPRPSPSMAKKKKKKKKIGNDLGDRT